MATKPKTQRKFKNRKQQRLNIGLLVLAIVVAGFVFYLQHRDTTSYTAHGQVYGVSLGSSVRDWDEQTLTTNFQRLQQLGVTSIRFDMPWSAVQPKDATHYNWKPYDRLISTADQYGFKSLVILDYTPAWARAKTCADSQFCPPADNAKFASYAASVVDRYSSQGVSTYEIWNEENSFQFWKPKSNVADYGALLHTTAAAMRAADSHVVIVTGGLSPAGDPSEAIAPRSFLQQLYDLGYKNDFDAIGLHPYTSPFVVGQAEAVNWDLMDSGDANVRSTMIANGDADKKIWVTEYGAATSGTGAGADNEVSSADYDHVSPAVQAAMAAAVIKSARSKPWLASVYWYTLRDGSPSNPDRENYFGLVDASNQPKPAFYALQQALKNQ